MRPSLIILPALLAISTASAQLSLSLGADRALPGERIPVSCSLTISEDYAPNRVTVEPVLIRENGERVQRGGIGGADGSRSAGGFLSYARDELVSGNCGLGYAPLVPGAYEYNVSVQFLGDPDQNPFVLNLTVDSLPAAPETLAFTRHFSDVQYGTRMAGYRFIVPEDRCYPIRLNPRISHIAVVDVSTGRVASTTVPGGHMSYESNNQATAIDSFNCVPSGVINDGIRTTTADSPGDWHLALIVGDREDPVCLGECDEPGAFNSAAQRIVALTPIEQTPAEPADSDFFFERITERGPRRVAEAAVGDLVRIVLEDPQASSERQVAITAGNETHIVDLEPDGHRLVSDVFVLGLEEGN